MSTSTKRTQKTKTKKVNNDASGDLQKVLLFNCNCHTFDSVIFQLMYATECSFEQAKRYAHIAHLNGKATVFTGTLKKCDLVADKLAEIGLIVRIVE